MQIYNNWLGLKEKHARLIVGLGNFDGLHLGHQKLIGDLVTKARAVGGTSAVFTFVPHPMSVLKPEDAPPLILPPGIKRQMFADLGVDVLILVPFNLEFSRMSPVDFILTVLHRHLGVHSVLIGYNYAFGHMGGGTPELLTQYGIQLGFDVQIINPVTVEGQPVSSTLIRSLINTGDIVEARKFLGYCPITEGDVVQGERRGNKLGFPTANIEIDPNYVTPPNGVYAVKVKVDRDVFMGVANIGVKPTFHGNAWHRTIEVHLLDFSGDLYGKRIRVYYTRRVRDERKFGSAGELVDQIHKDIMEVRQDAAGQV